MLYAIVAVLVIIADQWVKYWVAGAIPLESTGEAFIPGILSLVNLHNDGAAFSFLAGGGARIYFIILTGVFTVAVLIALATKFISGPVARWSLVLVTAGGLSNCIDRVIYGYVQDMFKCELFNFPVFNVADIFITVFCIVFIIAILFEKDRKDSDYYYDDAFEEDDLEDDYYEEEEEPAPRRAKKEKKAKKSRRAAYEDDYDDEDEYDDLPPLPAKKTKTQKSARRASDYDEEYAQYKAEKAAREREQQLAQEQAAAAAAQAAREQAAAARQAQAQASVRQQASAEVDPFSNWDRANARVQAQPQTAARQRVQVQPRPSTQSAAPTAQRPATQQSAAPARKPSVSLEEEFSLDDILAEFK